jgi:hypothetical protein
LISTDSFQLLKFDIFAFCSLIKHALITVVCTEM